jgi:hypothetical protein
VKHPEFLHVVNAYVNVANEGGTNRALALQDFVQKRGGMVLEVQDERFRRSARERLLRLPRLLQEIAIRRPVTLILAYPAYPFFWQHKVTPYYWMSRAFARPGEAGRESRRRARDCGRDGPAAHSIS